MTGIALKMLFADPVKLCGLVLGIAFSALLMTQQGGFFIGLISRSANIVVEASGVDVWVIDPQTETAEAPTSMRDIELFRVRGVEGVSQAVPLVLVNATLRTADGRSATAGFLGIDDATLLGINPKFVVGVPEDLRRPDAIAIDQLGYSRLWPGEPFVAGKTLEVNDRRAVVVAITSALPGFTAPVVVYTRLNQARAFVPGGRKRLSFILVQAQPGIAAEDLTQRIEVQTGLRAFTTVGLQRQTINYVLNNTGIAPSFGVVIALGAIVGVLVSGLTFTLFVNDNLKQFAVLKAMGVSGLRILGMVVTQALVVAFLGYSFGLWVASLFFDAVDQPLSDLKGFWLPWQIAAMVGGAIVIIVLIASVGAIRRVLSLDPATVFRA
ncbi:MAG: ABC transporter permease [Alphaproteobacteria bacterium]|nr:ABC transporter permease [Alphaproteobacteria bacterium]